MPPKNRTTPKKPHTSTSTPPPRTRKPNSPSPTPPLSTSRPRRNAIVPAFTPSPVSSSECLHHHHHHHKNELSHRSCGYEQSGGSSHSSRDRESPTPKRTLGRREAAGLGIVVDSGKSTGNAGKMEVEQILSSTAAREREGSGDGMEDVSQDVAVGGEDGRKVLRRVDGARDLVKLRMCEGGDAKEREGIDRS